MLRSLALLTIAAATVSCTSASGPAQPGAAERGPKAGDAITVEEQNDPYNFDLSIAGISRGNYHASGLAYESLLTFRRGPDVAYTSLQLAPNLAEGWEVSPDGRSYTFHLRKGVKFADLPPVNGREMTSADVRWSYEYHSRSGEFKDKNLQPGQFVTYFQGMQGIDTPDPATVVVRFEKPFAPFINYAGGYPIPILPREIYDQDGHFKDKIVGTGPFQLDTGASQKGTRWVFKKNSSYWEAGRPYLDQVRWLVLPDEVTIQSAFRTKQLDLIAAIGMNVLEQVNKEIPDVSSAPRTSLAGQQVYMNQRRPPFNDMRVRKAVSLATDRAEFVRTFTADKGRWSLSGAYPDHFTPEEVKQLLPYDPNEARKLLAEADHAGGLELEFFYPGNGFGEAYIAQMQLFQAQLKRVGINLTLKSFDLNDYLSRTRGNTYDITLRGTSVQADVDSYLYLSYHPQSPRNYNGVNDPKLTEMLEAQRAEVDPAKRREIIRQAVRYLTEQAYGFTTFTDVTYDIWHPQVKNYAPHATAGAWPVHAVWVDR